MLTLHGLSKCLALSGRRDTSSFLVGGFVKYKAHFTLSDLSKTSALHTLTYTLKARIGLHMCLEIVTLNSLYSMLALVSL